MSVETGEYIIVNARYHNLAYLPEAKNGTPVVAKYKQNDAYEKVSLTDHQSYRFYNPKSSSGSSENHGMEATPSRAWLTTCSL